MQLIAYQAVLATWWTRSQICRTAGEMAFEATILDTKPMAMYRRIAQEVNHLRGLGMSFSGIARHLKVDDKTVAKVVRSEHR